MSTDEKWRGNDATVQRKLQTSDQIDCFSVVPSHNGYFWDLVGVRNLGSAVDYSVLIKESMLEEKGFRIPK